MVEELDFRKKKAALRERSPRYARMLSAFAYRKFFQLLFSRAARYGVEVIEVNPAFTSVIGEVKFASGYGLSSHGAAAVAIARRGLRFGERLRSRSAFPLPARNRGKHVWSDWRRVAQRRRAERARGRCPSEGGRGRGIPLSSAAPVRGSGSGEGPPWDGFAAAPGRDSPAQTVGKTVRPACVV
ncbi:MAG: IS200/IS605 family accessory protein TnpB-related protein [Thermaerobacter sp.]|nr:IS200/IS605 family accessory protein TnpB-related protein [Thermaerobacter sp.]